MTGPGDERRTAVPATFGTSPDQPAGPYRDPAGGPYPQVPAGEPDPSGGPYPQGPAVAGGYPGGAVASAAVPPPVAAPPVTAPPASASTRARGAPSTGASVAAGG
ncbi:hypothetical protein ACWDUH_14740, partial [Micromonospora wenchangensis]